MPTKRKKRLAAGAVVRAGSGTSGSNAAKSTPNPISNRNMPTSGSISGANSRIPAGNLGKLKRELGLYDAAAIDIGAIIGAGIFVVIGVAASVAGAGLIFSLILAGAVSYITALSYAELSHRIPIEGGEYNFAYRLISHDAGFLDGVLWCLSTAVSGAVVSIGLSNYFVVLFPGLDQKLIAIAAIFLMALLNIVGIKRSSIVNEALVVMKIGILLFFILFGINQIRYENFDYAFSAGWEGIVQGAGIIFFAFAGFGRTATIAEEVKDPKNTLPKAILLALTVCTVIYILTGFVAMGLLGADRIALSPAPIAEAISVAGSRYAVILVAIGALAATASVLLTEILGISRISFSMARNKQLPAFLSRVHSKFGTPYVAIILSGILMAILAYTVNFRQIIELSSFGLLGYYAVTNFSALLMKREGAGIWKYLNKGRALLGVVSCIALMALLAQSLLAGV